MSENSIFLGKEIEGKDLGKSTLFIPRGCVAFSGVSRMYDKIKQLECRRIYFGAKERRGLDKEDIELITWLLKDRRYGIKYQILAEVENFDWVHYTDDVVIDRIEIIYVVKVPVSVPVQHIKIEDRFEVDWYVCKAPVVTKLDNTEYSNDKEIHV